MVIMRSSQEADWRHRWPSAHDGTDQAMAQAVRNVRRERPRDTQTKQPLRGLVPTLFFRHAKSSITIERA